MFFEGFSKGVFGKVADVFLGVGFDLERAYDPPS